MANMHSSYEPGSSVTPAQRQNLELIELDLIHHPHGEATNIAPTHSSSQHAKTASASIEHEHETAASTPRRISFRDSYIELYDVDRQHDEADVGEVQLSLPPVDTGKDAWLFLFSAFVMDVLVWGTFSVKLPHSACTDITQASPLPLASSRSSTPRTRPSKASETFPLSVPVPWG